jgi:hypothetical protein
MEQLAGRHYFVDEASDLTLFNKRGRVIVGTEGVSSVFMLGFAELPDPKAASLALETLRTDLLSDPYFRGVPSMQPAAKKTSLCFHAKDDLPEVRREVFRVIASLGVKMYVAIRRKSALALEARSLRARGHSLRADDIYDDLVTRLVNSLPASIESVSGEPPAPRFTPSVVTSGYPHQFVGLQVVDYYLWALQRFFERREDRFFNFIAPQFKLIEDMDYADGKGPSMRYDESNPLTLEKLKPAAS